MERFLEVLIKNLIDFYLLAVCSKVLGRRMSMIYCDLIALIGVMFTMLGPYVLVIIGRLIVGFTVGINCTAVTMYINEVSPASLTGLMGAQWQAFVNVGIEMTNFIGFGRPSIEKAKAEGMGNNFWRI